MNPVMLIIFCCPMLLGSSAPGTVEIRKLYEASVADETACKKLITLLAPYSENNNPLYAGYKAAATMVMAKHAFNPVSKFSYFKKGRNLLEAAISKNKTDIELRYLRFTIQTNLPWFLDYRDDIRADKTFLLQNFSKVNDSGLKQMLVAFLTASPELTPAEKKMLTVFHR